jgi:RNA polymerase subunit RPABC4/transcription elongation factor Spt4
MPNLSTITNRPRFETTTTLIDEDGVESDIVRRLCLSPTTTGELRYVTIITDRKSTKIAGRISIHVDTVEDGCMSASERTSP